MNFTEVDKGTDVSIDVREEDQKRINEFSRNAKRIQELDEEMSAQKVRPASLSLSLFQ